MTLISKITYAKSNLWIPQIRVEIVALCAKLHSIYGDMNVVGQNSYRYNLLYKRMIFIIKYNLV